VALLLQGDGRFVFQSCLPELGLRLIQLGLPCPDIELADRISGLDPLTLQARHCGDAAGGLGLHLNLQLGLGPAAQGQLRRMGLVHKGPHAN
jgi:hypothetical protein